MKKIKSYLCLVIFIVNGLLCVTTSAETEELSLRRCMLLPITDSLNGAIAFQVYEKIEGYLKESTWCIYKHNSDIINILGNYKRNLTEHLQNENVLKLVAKNVGAGTLIRIKLQSQIKGIEVSMEIIGPNGHDIYFREKTLLNDDSIEIISRTIENWLEIYEKSIPYDGQVISVLGNQFTIDIGKTFNVRIGDGVIVKRPTSKKEHPLLKEVVEWESEIIGKGNIFSVSEQQAAGQIKQYYSDKRPKKGDWVRVDRTENQQSVKEHQFPAVNDHEFGKLGIVSLKLITGKGSVATHFGGRSRKIGGYNLGFHLNSEIWATRSLFGALEIARIFGSYDAETTTSTQANNNVSKGIIKVLGGYKFLPLGFFYGPQVDVYGGYGRHSINADTNLSEGYGEWVLSGLLLGVRGSAPIHRSIRLFLRFDTIPLGGYSEETNLFGNAKSAKSFEFEFGGSYVYSPLINFDAGLNLLSSKAIFNNTSNSEVHSQDLVLKLGASFTF